MRRLQSPIRPRGICKGAVCAAPGLGLGICAGGRAIRPAAGGRRLHKLLCGIRPISVQKHTKNMGAAVVKTGSFCVQEISLARLPECEKSDG